MFVTNVFFRILSVVLWLFVAGCDADGLGDSKLSSPQEVSTDNEKNEVSYSLSVLVDSHWLYAEKNRSKTVIIDFSYDRESYNKGHISGAHFLDWRTDIVDSDLPDYYALLPIENYEFLLSGLGVESDSTVVLYDEMSSRAAVRFFWMMKYYGHRDVRVLDGGKSKWVDAGFELVEGVEETELTSYKVTEVVSDLLVNMAGVKRAIASSSHVLVDGRPFDQYTGGSYGKVFHTQVEHQRLGHIYGAKSVPWADNFNPDGTFKSLSELHAIYSGRHINAQLKVITYCNEGLHAAVPWFVLSQLLGYRNVALYDESMAEWGNREDTAIVLGQHCM